MFMKKIIRMAAMLTVAGAALLSSCTKDYGTDIEQLQKENAALQAAVNSLEGQIKSGAIITSVTSTDKGVTIATTNGSYTINNGAAGKDGKDGKDGTVIDVKDGYWTINGEKTEWKVVTDEDSVKVPFVNEDGLWVFYNEDGEEVVSPHRVAPVTAVKNEDGSYTLTIYNAEGEATVIKLPTAASSITDLIILSPATPKIEYWQYTFTMPMNKADWKGPRELPMARTGETINIVADVTATPAEIQVNPASLEVADVEFYLVNSKNGRPSDVTLTLAEDKDLMSRAYGNGLYKIAMEDVFISSAYAGYFMAQYANQFKDPVTPTKNIMYAITAGGDVRSKYDVTVEAAAAGKTLTGVKVNNGATNALNSTTGTFTANIGTWYPVTATDAAALYDMYLSADADEVNLFGLEFKNEEGNWAFRLTKAPDTITPAPFTLNVQTIDKNGTLATTKIKVTQSSVIAGLYMADPIVHTIKTVAAQNVFDVDLAGMKAALGSQVSLWNNKVALASTTYALYEEMENGDVKASSVVPGVVAAGALLVPAINKANNTAATATSEAAKLRISVDNTKAAAAGLIVGEEYYIKVIFNTSAPAEVSSMIIPVTFVAPKLADLFEIKTGYVDPADGVINAYFYDLAGVKTVETIKYFSKFVANATLAADNQAEVAKVGITSYKSNGLTSADIATFAASATVGAKLSLTAVYPMPGANQEVGYNKVLTYNVSKTNYEGWNYDPFSADGRYSFKIRIASPIEQGSIKPVSGSSIVISGNDLVAGAKIGADAIKGYDYNNNPYNVVPDKAAATPAWADPQIANVAVGVDALGYITTATVEKATTNAAGATVNGYFAVKGNSISQSVDVKMPVTVTDVWGYTKRVEVPVTIQKNN